MLKAAAHVYSPVKICFRTADGRFSPRMSTIAAQLRGRGPRNCSCPILKSPPASPGAHVPVLGAVVWDNGGLAIGSSVSLPVPSWTPLLLVQAPATGFTSFSEGDQPAIYAYLSNQFPETTNGDIRGCYTNSEWAGKFAPFSVQLSGEVTPPPDSAWSQGDWDAVRNILAAECNCVDTVYTAYND